jgi:hypothetical protein
MNNIITSLNNKGYTIIKTKENEEIINKIKKELLITPKIWL